MSTINHSEIRQITQYSRLTEFDFVRGVSILGVLIIHITGKYLPKLDTNSFSYSVFIIVNQIQRFCVPCFLIMSGFLLAYKKSNSFSSNKLLRKRLSKVFFPYLIWSCFFEIYYFLLFQKEIRLGGVIKNLITGSSVYVYYFIILILQLYLIWWLLNKCEIKITAKILALALAIQLSFTIYNYLSILNYVTPLHYLSDRSLFGWIFYFILGIYLATYTQKDKMKKTLLHLRWLPSKTLAVIALIFLLLSLVEFYHVGLISLNYEFARSFFKLSSQFYAIAAFFWMISVSFKHPLIELLSKYSFPIYLIHAPILDLIFPFLNLVFADNVYISFISVFIMLLSICCLVIYITPKIFPRKALKYIWGF